MRILGIETSCDETATAVVEDGTKILSNVIASSVELHKKTGGIIPEVAAREQVRCIVPVIEEAIKPLSYEAIKKENSIAQLLGGLVANIDAIAVTVGPGLIGSLLVGVETAKTLAYVFNKPIVPVNHLLAHLYANFIHTTPNSKLQTPNFPVIGLVVSGGHTDLVLMKNHGKLKWLGGTRDDAAGECFDKTARLLGLGYPGGPAIQKAAEKGNSKAFNLPRPMIKQENFDFSFSGLKTAVVNRVKEQESKRVKINVSDMAASIQQAIVDVLVEKTIHAARRYKVKSILLAGGVAANQLLRKELATKLSSYQAIELYLPPLKLCTDNAAIIASCAYFNYKPIAWQKITVNPGLGIAEADVDKT